MLLGPRDCFVVNIDCGYVVNYFFSRLTNVSKQLAAILDCNNFQYIEKFLKIWHNFENFSNTKSKTTKNFGENSSELSLEAESAVATLFDHEVIPEKIDGNGAIEGMTISEVSSLKL